MAVDDTGTFTHQHSLAVDDFGGVHFAYYETVGADLRYALLSPTGTWTRRTLDASGTTGLSPSIDLDSTGRAHIAYWRGTTSDLAHATGVECW